MPKEEKETKTETTEKKNRYEIAEVTQVSGYVAKDSSSGETYSLLEAVVKLMNDVDKIKNHLM